MGCSSSSSADESYLEEQGIRDVEPVQFTDKDAWCERLRRNLVLSPILESWTQDDLDTLLSRVRAVPVAKADELFGEGTFATGMYLVHSGQFAHPDTNKIFKEGDFIGETVIAVGNSEKNTVTALEDSVVFFLARKDFTAMRNNVIERERIEYASRKAERRSSKKAERRLSKSKKRRSKSAEADEDAADIDGDDSKIEPGSNQGRLDLPDINLEQSSGGCSIFGLQLFGIL